MASRRSSNPATRSGGTSPPSQENTDEPRRVGDLEIVQDEPWQRRMGYVQSASWIGLYTFVALGLLGLFGNGPLSNVTAGNGTSLQVEYERFVRADHTTVMRLRLAQGAATGAEARVWIDAAAFREAVLRRVTPTPRSVSVGPNRHLLTFDLNATGAPAELRLEWEPRSAGLRSTHLGLDGTPGVRIRRFVFP